MKISHKLFIASAVALPAVGLTGMSIASATSNTMSQDKRDSFATNLATKFNLNKNDVTKFMDEQKASRESQMKTKVTDALKTAGYTDTQIKALQGKRNEQRTAMQTWRDANPNATREDMKAHHDAERTEMEAWAKEQGIDLTKIQETLKTAGLGRGHAHGMGGMKDADDTSTAK